MIVIREGNLFETTAPIIAHQVNCRGVMGSGVAKQVRELYPGCYEAYKTYCRDFKPLLGNVCWWTDGNIRIANMFAQNGYGYDGKKYTNVEAFKRCAENIRKANHNVAMPYNIGCCRGGADWDSEIYPILESLFENAPLTLELWRLE